MSTLSTAKLKYFEKSCPSFAPQEFWTYKTVFKVRLVTSECTSLYGNTGTVDSGLLLLLPYLAFLRLQCSFNYTCAFIAVTFECFLCEEPLHR